MSAEAALYPNEYIGRVEIEMKRNPVAIAAEKEAGDKEKPALPFFSLPKFLQQDPPANNAAPNNAPVKAPQAVPNVPQVVPPSVMKPSDVPTIPMPPPPPSTKQPEVLPPPVPNVPVK
jgi:hypothetical protein